VHCYQHCGECLGACPEGRAIDDVLRYRMYFEDYGDEKEAIRLYARLDRQADACLNCGGACGGACPHGVHIQDRMIGAHRLLTLA
jgi:ferredoxin